MLIPNPLSDENCTVHLHAVWQVKAEHIPLVRVPTWSTGQCNLSHKETTVCPECRHNSCQICGDPNEGVVTAGGGAGGVLTTTVFSGWSRICAQCAPGEHELPTIPDLWKEAYPAPEPEQAVAPPSQPYKAAVLKPAAAPAAPRSGSARMSFTRGANEGGGGPAWPIPPRQATKPPRPSAGEGGAAAADPPPSETIILLSSSDEEKAEKGIKAEAIPEAKEKEETPEERALREFHEAHPDIAKYWAENGLTGKRMVQIYDHKSPSNPEKNIEEVYAVATLLENGRKKSIETKQIPPVGFEYARNPMPITINQIIRLEDHEQRLRFDLELELARKRNAERPDAQRVPDEEMVRIFIHGTSKKHAESIARFGLRGIMNRNSRFGKGGLYGSFDNTGVPINYADGCCSQGSDDTSTLLVCKVIAGRQADTECTYNSTDLMAAPEGYETGGCGNDWVAVVFDNSRILPLYMVVCTTKFLSDVIGANAWQTQLESIKAAYEQHTRQKEETADPPSETGDGGGAAKKTAPKRPPRAPRKWLASKTATRAPPSAQTAGASQVTTTTVTTTTAT